MTHRHSSGALVGAQIITSPDLSMDLLGHLRYSEDAHLLVTVFRISGSSLLDSYKVDRPNCFAL